MPIIRSPDRLLAASPGQPRRAPRAGLAYLIGSAMACSTAPAAGLFITSVSERAGCVIVALRGELDIASAPTLREELLALLRPGASRLVIDLSAVGYADASGIAVLVGSRRRAGLLGGWLRLAAPTPAIAEVLAATGLDRHLATFPTVEAAIIGPLSHTGTARTGASILGRAIPAQPPPTATRRIADGKKLRAAVSALLANADAWRDADPRRQFAPALNALAVANGGDSDAALIQAARSLLTILGREPLVHSREVASTARRLRRLLYPDYRELDLPA
jgi:anti-anti-sigma factor